MELKHIKAGGKDRPFLFSYRATRELAETDLSEKDELEFMAYLGFKYGAIKENQEPTFNEQDIPDWFEDDMSSFIEVQKALQEMQPEMEKMMAPQNRQQRRSQKKKEV